jgi:aspartyl-tRNA(Asn)/glutamyl-tRNA(Gln) amidotransferase subunit C
MSLTKEQVQHIAQLARLSLTENEVSQFQQQLSDILAYFDQIQGVDTSEVAAHGELETQDSRLRADTPYPGLSMDDLSKNSGSMQDGQFKVPPVLEG